MGLDANFWQGFQYGASRVPTHRDYVESTGHSTSNERQLLLSRSVRPVLQDLVTKVSGARPITGLDENL